MAALVVPALLLIALMISSAPIARHRALIYGYPSGRLIPAALVIVASVVDAAVRYPGMPDRVPVHWAGSDLVADRFAAKSPGLAFGLVAVEVLLTGILAFAGRLMMLLSARPLRARRRAQSLLGLAAGLDFALLLSAQPILRAERDLPAGLVAGVIVVVLAGLIFPGISWMQSRHLDPRMPFEQDHEPRRHSRRR